MRWSRALAALVLMMLVAACGSPAATDGGDGGGDGTTESEPAEPTPADGGGGGDGGNGGSGSLDVDRVRDSHAPNATELSRTAASGVIFAAWDTDESFDSLRSFYENGIDEAGLEIISTTEAQDGVAWAVAENENSTFGGAMSLLSASDGSGTQISVTIGGGG